MAAAKGGRHTTVGLYGVTVVLNGLISLITIPVIVAVAGANHWASMATGQSIGSTFAVLVIFGWGLTGPVMIAGMRQADRPRLFLDSLFARGALLVPVLLAQALVTTAIVPHEKGVAFVAGAAMTLAGASANWFFTGEGRAGRYLMLDTVPRVAGTILGGALLVLTHELLFFAVAQLLGAVVAIAVSSFVILRGHHLDIRAAARPRRILSSLREQRHGVVATGLFAAYMPAVLAIVALFSPATLPLFVLADRLTKFVGMAVSPMFQMFQGWVPAASGAELARRIRAAGLISAATGVLGGGLYVLLLPFISNVLTHGQIAYPFPLPLAFGLLTFSQILSPFLSTVALMAVGRVRLIALTAVLGVPLALIALVIVETFGAPSTAVWTIVVGNLAIMAWHGLALRRPLQRLTQQLTPNTTAPLLIKESVSGGVIL